MSRPLRHRGGPALEMPQNRVAAQQLRDKTTRVGRMNKWDLEEEALELKAFSTGRSFKLNCKKDQRNQEIRTAHACRTEQGDHTVPRAHARRSSGGNALSVSSLAKSRTTVRRRERDLKADVMLAGLYRPLRNVILVPPWEFAFGRRRNASSKACSRAEVLFWQWNVARDHHHAERNMIHSSDGGVDVLQRSLGPVLVPASLAPRDSGTCACTAQSLLESATSGPMVEVVDGASALAQQRKEMPDGPLVPAIAEAMSEDDTAELSRWASEEAAQCLTSIGSVDGRRLRRLLFNAQPRFARMVLSRLPPKELRQLIDDGPEAICQRGLQPRLLASLLTGDVFNSALIAEHDRARAAWLRRPVPSDCGDFIAPVGPELRIAVPVFGHGGGVIQNVAYRALDADESHHPAVRAQCSSGPLVFVPSRAAFRLLLSAFTHGIADELPWGSGVVLGGSACFACMAMPAQILQRWRGRIGEATTLHSMRALQHGVMVRALGGRSSSVTELIMDFADDGYRKRARTMLQPLAEELFGSQSPYASADIDVFIVAASKSEAAGALEQTRLVVANAMSSTCCHVQTPNSVTLCGPAPFRHVQLVTKLAENVSEIVSNVDLHCTGFCFDGIGLWSSPCALRALQLGHNFMGNHQLCNSESIRRVAKYASRGCGTLVYEVCRHDPRCDVELDDDTAWWLKQAQGIVDQGGYARRTATCPSSLNLGSAHGYDDFHLPSGCPSDVKDFVRKSRCTTSKRGPRLHKRAPALEIVEPLGHTSWWLPKLAWRREGAAQLRRKFGLNAGQRSRCYMCGGVVLPSPSDTTDNRRIRSGAQNGEQAVKKRVPVCAECEKKNAHRRADREDLSGFTAVVTGGRCKIGYEACLMLLRCGAFVVASTRFPSVASKRFLCEPDAAEWCERLHIYGVDFSSFPTLQSFTEQLTSYYRVDVLINNAAQTIRRPPSYYQDLVDNERAIWADHSNQYLRCIVGDVRRCVRELGVDPWAALASASPQCVTPCAASATALPPSSSGLALTSFILGDIAAADRETAPELFPAGAMDIHGEQLDLRPKTSWSSTLVGSGVQPRELLEALGVNAAAPFILLQSLIPVLTRRDAAVTRGRFVVNVSSAEGVFSSEGAAAKGPEHPHSNMAKAALNMLTKTVASQLCSHGVYVVAVDPGWVSMMRPGDPDARGRPLPPLSEADGAARIVAPVLDGVRQLRAGRAPLIGVLLKNFAPAPW